MGCAALGGACGQLRANTGMAVGANCNARRGDRLRSWKEIASFFGTDERTVRRWEGRGLPVRRVPGGGRATVYAEVAELDAWMRGRSAHRAAEPPAEPRRQRPHLVFASGLSALLLLGGVGAWVATTRGSAPPATHVPTRAAADLYLSGRYNWERRTPESLARAAQQFRQALAADPAYAEAYAGLADTYLLLREYADLPDEEAYPVAREAAQRALALDPNAADAHAALAFVTMYWDCDFRRGIEGFRRAASLDPRSARVRHWYATALYHAGRAAEALEQIDEAQRLDPPSHAIVSDKALILFELGRSDEARRLLDEIARAEPGYLSPHTYLAMINLAAGDHRGWLREAETAARLSEDRTRAEVLEAGEVALMAGGPRAMFAAMAARQAALMREGRETAFELAATQALLGRADEAMQLLRLSAARNESAIVAIRIDPRFRTLHGDAAFRSLAARVRERR